jgi:GxxExxY protein
MKPPMDANERELILKEEVYAVVGCAIEVLNVRGHGLHEKIYENCLCVEFRLREIPYTQQERMGATRPDQGTARTANERE